MAAATINMETASSVRHTSFNCIDRYLFLTSKVIACALIVINILGITGYISAYDLSICNLSLIAPMLLISLALNYKAIKVNNSVLEKKDETPDKKFEKYYKATNQQHIFQETLFVLASITAIVLIVLGMQNSFDLDLLNIYMLAYSVSSLVIQMFVFQTVRQWAALHSNFEAKLI